MRRNHLWALGLVLALPILCLDVRTEAEGIILKRIHQHGDCPADKQVIRIPAQEIQIITAQPRVVVGSSSMRMRGYFPAGQAFAPVGQGPFVATFVPMTGTTFGCSQPAAGSSALNAVHALARQHLEFDRQKASRQGEMDHVDKAFKRVQSGLPAPAPAPSDPTQLQKSLDDLTK